jgi:hypothetical protein
VNAAKRYEKQETTAPKYAGIPVTRPQGMWLVYLDMLGIQWEFEELNGEGDVMVVTLQGKGVAGVSAMIVQNDFLLRKYQRGIAQKMRDQTVKGLLILGQAPEELQAGIRKVSYIRRGRNGLFHEHVYINCKGEIQSLNNTTFVNGFVAFPKEATTAYLTYCTENENLLEAHNRAARVAWEWNFDKDGRCIEIEETEQSTKEVQADDPVFIAKGTGGRPDDPTFIQPVKARQRDCYVSPTSGNVVGISFTETAIKKITDTGHIRISEATEQNPVIYFMEGGEDDFKISPINSKVRPHRAQPTAAAMAELIKRKNYKGYYDLQQVTTKSGTKYWCIKLEAHDGK